MILTLAVAGSVIYAPVVTTELRNQVKAWYNHLPPAIRFPIDASPMFDSRKSFLRGQCITLFVVLWPCVLQFLEHGETTPSETVADDEMFAAAREQIHEQCWQ